MSADGVADAAGPSQRYGPLVVARCSTTNGAGVFYAPDPRSGSGVRAAEAPDEVIKGVGGTWHLDEDWLVAWLLGCADARGTPFAGLQRLLPGQQLVRNRDGGLEVIDTIGPDVWPEPDLAGADAQVALVEAIDVAVAELAGSQPRVACELSGGLDSSFVVASLASRLGTEIEIRAFTHVPSPAAVLRPGGWVASDAAAAQTLVEQYRPHIDWTELHNDSGRGPLDMAQRVTNRAWWPAYGPGNLEWLDSIRTTAEAAGFSQVWVGSHGNAAFSVDYTYDLRPRPQPWRASVRGRARKWWSDRRRGPTSGGPGATGWFLREPPAPTAAMGRREYLVWLAGHRGVHGGLLNRAAFGIASVDPYRHPLVLETAARIRPDSWRRPGMTRGLARAASAGRVPDAVRLRVARGAQALDVWQWMLGDRELYFETLAGLADVDWLADVVDIEAIRQVLTRWPWGQPEPPPMGEIRRVNRLLAFARFVTDMRVRLAA